MNKKDVEKLLDRLDPDAREAFVEMALENQLLILFSIEMSNSNRLAVVEKRQIDSETDIKLYRRQREMKEDNSDEEVMNTTQKIIKVLAEAKAKEFNTWIYVRDRVLPNILSPAILILLYLIFTQLKP